MICKRCGYCCIMCDVVIPMPSNKANVIIGSYKQSGKRCWNLEFQDGIAVCKIHDMKIYKKSPCSTHHNDKCKDECRMGVFLLNDPVNLNYLEEMRNYPIAVSDPIELQINRKE